MVLSANVNVFWQEHNHQNKILYISDLFYGSYQILQYIRIYLLFMFSHYLKFLNNVTQYTLLNTIKFNLDHKIIFHHFI
jgi:hypothetical protein